MDETEERISLMAQMPNSTGAKVDVERTVPSGGDSPSPSGFPKTQDDEQLLLRRRVYTQKALEQVYPDTKKPKTVGDWLRTHFRCSARCVGACALGYFPVVKTIRHYKWGQWTLTDMIAGLSVGFFHLPQGLGFGLLASLTPAVGLYTSFFPILTYLVFGTSPHVSMGTQGLIALIMGSVVDREVQILQNTHSGNLTDIQVAHFKVGIATSTCLVSGVLLLAMGIFKLGFITNFLSGSCVGGFTFGAAIHILTNEAVRILNLDIPNRSGTGKLVLRHVDMFMNISQSNVADVVIGVVCLIILLAVKLGVNERYRKKLPVPIPIELILVILTTVTSHFAELRDRYGIAVVGHVPTGVPAPSLPSLDTVPRVATDAFVIAVLCFALTIAVGKMCAKLHGYELDDNQELVAYGMCHLVGAFFQNFPSCIAPPRTMLLSSLGAKSTLNGLTSAAFLLIVLLAAGQLFVSLPIAMLAAMIIVAIKELLLQVRQLRSLWHINKSDFVIWVLTALATVFGDLDIGLFTGVGVSMVTVLAVGQVAKGTLLGRARSEDVVMDTRHDGIMSLPGVRIFRFEAPLYYATAERFKAQLYSLVLDPLKSSATMTVDQTSNAKVLETVAEIPHKQQSSVSQTPEDNDLKDRIHYVILDCSSMTYIDMAGIDILSLVIGQISMAGAHVMLAAVPTATLATLRRSNFFERNSENDVYYSVFDAIQRMSPYSQKTILD